MEGVTKGEEYDEKGKKKEIYLEVITADRLEGQLIKKRFMVSHPLDKGSFGTIYECIDLNHPNQ
jgi:hypothetical protein